MVALPTDGQMEFAIANKQKVASLPTWELGELNTKTNF